MCLGFVINTQLGPARFNLSRLLSHLARSNRTRLCLQYTASVHLDSLNLVEASLQLNLISSAKTTFLRP